MEEDIVNRLEALEKSHLALEQEYLRLRNFVYTDYFFNRLFEKAFQVMCYGGDYLEFGVFKGASMIQAYQAAERIFQQLDSEHWDAGIVDKGKKDKFRESWQQMRFIGFDTFSGMPQLDTVDAQYEIFEEGSFGTSLEACKSNLASAGLEMDKVTLVEGKFDETLTPDTATELQLSKLSVVHIDCDLYSSSKAALDFITPYLQDGTVLIFDEWFHYRGNPTLGEQRALSEWSESNPELTLTQFHKEGPYRNSFIVSTESY